MFLELGSFKFLRSVEFENILLNGYFEDLEIVCSTMFVSKLIFCRISKNYISIDLKLSLLTSQRIKIPSSYPRLIVTNVSLLSNESVSVCYLVGFSSRRSYFSSNVNFHGKTDSLSKSVHLRSKKPILVTHFSNLLGKKKKEKVGIRIVISGYHILTRNPVGKGRSLGKKFPLDFSSGIGSIDRDPLTRNEERYVRKSDGPV